MHDRLTTSVAATSLRAKGPMNRLTVIDIAQQAGASLATVARALDARPGVKARTVSAAQDAIHRIACVRRHDRFLAALPDGESQFIKPHEQALAKAARTSRRTPPG